ncbi:PP2C family protein-serine/threonine phosphatase [Rhodococcoides trifolii]|uniref:PP2C family protein-serine/threonine phosphatase n=1 Tax=Rhodococcoides trifolii TaxID=908250 RepID=UPI0035300467
MPPRVRLDGVEATRYLDTAPAGFLVVDAGTNTITYVNATLCRVVGAAALDIVGREAQDLFTASSRAMVTALLAAGSDADTDIPTGATAEMHVGAGATLSVLLMANRSVEPEGPVVRVTFHAATAHRIREQDLIDARDDAENAQSIAENALYRSRDALEESEGARKSAEAERTQVQILATTLQRTLLPPVLSAPTGMDISAYYHHASDDEVGGDFYDVFPLDPQTWGFFLGDVSGKGAGAAAVTSLTRYTLRAAAVFDRDPVSVLHNLNTVLHHEFRGDDPRFCTVVYGTITPTDDGAVISLASGGHPPALHLRADGTAAYVDTVGGQLVGALSDPHFRSAELTLAPGDSFLLYTDGLTEAHVGPGRIRYDDTGALLEFADAAAPTTAARVVDDLIGVLTSFGDGLQDDVALLALGVPPADARHSS